MSEMIGSTIGGIFGYMGAKREEQGYKDAKLLQEKNLEFQLKRYEDWKKVYGSLQEDLGAYYKNLTGEHLSDLELQKLQKSMQQANKKITEQIAERGITGSGLEASLINANIYNTEMKKAESLATADDRVNAMKANFLAGGLASEHMIGNTIANSYGNLSRAAIGYGKARGDTLKGVGEFVGYMGNRIENSFTGLFDPTSFVGLNK